MVRPVILLVLLAAGACASRGEVSEAEARINALADERRSEDRYPVLGPLPQADQVFTEEPGAEPGALREAAAPLIGLRQAAAEPRPVQSLDAVVAELRAEVAALRNEPPRRAAPAVSREALGFPTPPPVD